MNKDAYNILLIENDQTLCATMQKWLKDKAHLVHVGDTFQAQKMITSQNWDLVITDTTSETINNLDITSLIKEKNPFTSVLILTENIKVDFLLKAIRSHADDLLFKPLDQSIFLEKVFELAKISRNKRQKTKKIILAIGSHPDDVEFGCGGTLAKHRAEGAELAILTLSLGGAGGNTAIRKKESQQAAERLGAKVHFGQFLDTKLLNTSKTIGFINEIVQEVTPSHIYTHSLNDTHQDHRNVYQATLPACRHLSNIFCYLAPSSTVDFKPNIFVIIDEFMELKLDVLSLYSSQAEIRPYLKPDLVRATARYWGRFMNYHLVEPMEVIKFT